MLSVTQACCYVPIESGDIAAHAIMQKWTCMERVLCAPIDYGHLTSQEQITKHKTDHILKIFISSSTVVIPAIPKFSTNTSAIFGERNAGRVGPR